jgi:hypothetical protein
MQTKLIKLFEILAEVIFYRVVLKCISQITRPLQPKRFNIMCDDMGRQQTAVSLHTGERWLLWGKMSLGCH